MIDSATLGQMTDEQLATLVQAALAVLGERMGESSIEWDLSRSADEIREQQNIIRARLIALEASYESGLR